ncbi:pilus assembly protein [Neorhizobium sp. T786]|uniref:TadE/TadG family type IV pilus assembly protein n=1 Tax=Pseudorhizobium xiangyangii TaxID=2883104 RepID=UPI001CFF7BA2|nr:TadE/TadG family type IV pilus assembly protein [Neorhizobium xiangyangii]MCB5205488.1 pilus assembly protein [Neorhizobium xiangyangii]
MLRRLFRDRSGNFGMMTALLAVPIIGTAGLAVDFTNVMFVQNSLQSAADAAALGAINSSSIGVNSAMYMQQNGVIAEAEADASKIFAAHLSIMDDVELISSGARIVKEDNQLKARFSYTASVPMTLTRILGKDTVTITGEATAVFQTQTFRDFYLLLDNTPSMGVGATPADVNRMVANTSDKCAFACHIVKDGVEDKNSYYNKAKKLGVTIRINVVAKATAALMDTATSKRTSTNQYKMAVYTFGEKAEDTKLLEVVGITDDLAKVKSRASLIDLMSIPKQGYDNDQQTNFDRALKDIGTKMGPPGTGQTSSSPEKIVFFVSDGVGDSYKPSKCTKKTTGGRCQEPIDVRECTALKDKGYRIAVLYTTYLPLPTNNWYNEWIKPFQTEIAPRMKECASPGLFFEVSPTEGISDAMSALFLKIINTPRLTG